MPGADMLERFRKNSEQGPPRRNEAVSRPDARNAFPRGSGDPYRATATAAWPDSAQIAALADDPSVKAFERWQPGSTTLLLGRDHAGAYYGVRDDRHVCLISGSRAGKGVSLAIPNLLFWPGSVIAIDPKGELATITAARRSASGSAWSTPLRPGEGEVYALDPFGRVTGDAARFAEAGFNPLAGLDPRTDAGLDTAWQIADALIIQAEGDGAHWTQSGRTFLRGLILFVAHTREADAANLIEVRRLLTQDRKSFNAMLAEMRAAKKPDDPNAGLDLIARTAAAMENKPGTERFNIVSTCETHTAFLEGEAMRKVLCRSSFAMEDLKRKLVTVYLCLPATRLATHGRWLRMMVALALDAMERTGPLEQGRPPVLFVLDEFAALGHMESIEKAAGQIAGFGVKLWPIVQDLTQLQRDYKAAWETFMGNAGVLTFFGNTDITTAEHITKRLGETEVIQHTQSAQTNSGESSPDAWAILQGAPQAGTQQKGTTQSIGQQRARGPLMNPNEVMQHFARDAGKLLAFVAAEKVPPLPLYRTVYHAADEDALYGGLFDPVPGQPDPLTTRAQRAARARP